MSKDLTDIEENLGPATIPVPGEEIKKMLVEGELVGGDEYLTSFVDTELVDEGNSDSPDLRELKDRLVKSGL